MRRQKPKWSAPRHPWKLDRILEENELMREYGLKKKIEIWRMQNKLANWQSHAKSIIGLSEREKEKKQRILIEKLQKLGLVDANADLDDVLGLALRDVLEKRLQTILYKKGLASTALQARQFITHNKVMVNGEKINSPSYLVKVADNLGFVPSFTPTVARAKAELQEAKEIKEGKDKRVENA